MDEKKLIKMGSKLAHELIDMLERDLIGDEPKKKEKRKDGKGRKKLSGNTDSDNSSS